VRAALAALWGGGGGALSAPPAIFGVVAEAEVKRLRPLSSGVDVGEAAALELAAAEMAAAAADLVSVEREVAAAAASRDAAAAAAAESRRTEAAAILERRMAAMEAALAARRTLAMGGPLAAAAGAATLAPEREAAPPDMADPFAAFRPPAVAAPTTSSGPAAGNGYELILQAFNWESHRGAPAAPGNSSLVSWYVHLMSRLDEVVDAGFTSVWLPPPSDSVSPQGYLPRDLYKLDSAYGSEGELRALVDAMRDRGLKAVADIVINHRCAHTQDEQGRWNRFGGRLPWDETAVCCNNPAFGGRGGHKTGEDYTAAPNIDHTNERVRDDLARWLAYLRTSIGFDG
jgi:alpha-amylase